MNVVVNSSLLRGVCTLADEAGDAASSALLQLDALKPHGRDCAAGMLLSLPILVADTFESQRPNLRLFGVAGDGVDVSKSGITSM